jgi:MOSC domain-containing protein YiiM
MGKILSINISKEKGTIKTPIKSAELLVNHGILGDAHAKNWHRQISLLADESIESMRKTLGENAFNVLKPGVFAENILTTGIALKSLPIGTKLRIGETIHEVTQIGKECHHGCEIRQIVGDCVMPREGIFTKVIQSGEIYVDDLVEVIEE